MWSSAFLFPAPPDSPKAINSGGWGAEPPRDNLPAFDTAGCCAAVLVVVAAPSFDLLFSILQTQKPVFIQALLPKPAVERFDEGVICGLAWPGKIQNYVTSISPQVNFFGDELRTIVRPDALRHRRLESKPVPDSGFPVPVRREKVIRVIQWAVSIVPKPKLIEKSVKCLI